MNELMTDEVEAILCEILLHVPKDESRFASRDGFSDLWDEFALDIADHPNAVIDIPPEAV